MSISCSLPIGCKIFMHPLLHFHRHIKTNRQAFIVLSILMALFSAAVSLTIYIDSSFLTETISQSALAATPLGDDPDRIVGALYTFSSLFTIILLLYAPAFLRKFGNYRFTVSILGLHTLLLLGLAISDSAWFIIPMFVVANAFVSVLYYNFDIFIERYARAEDVGAIRGAFLAIGSLAWLLPPVAAGYIAEHYGYAHVYLIAAAIIVPMIFLLSRYLADYEDMVYDDAGHREARAHLARSPNIRNILSVNFLMHCFYALMIIYSPLYLHNTVGLSVSEVGLVLTIALLAFVIFPYPTGRIADRWLGEKELLAAGFVLMAMTTGAMPFLETAGYGVIGWGVLLFVGRIGASTVETMAETYFFKQVDGGNAALIGYFRRTRPMAFIAAPLLASILLEFGVVDLAEIFFVLAAVMVVALHFVLALEDTK